MNTKKLKKMYKIWQLVSRWTDGCFSDFKDFQEFEIYYKNNKKDGFLGQLKKII